jgi:hypothetical protein
VTDHRFPHGPLLNGPEIAKAPAVDESSGAPVSRANTAPLSVEQDSSPSPGRASAPASATRPWHFGYLLTDHVLFHPRLSHAAKLVLAATLAYPNRDPSLTQLEAATGLGRLTIINAQNELEREQITGLDRPRHPWERHADKPRFQRTSKLAWIAPEADPLQRANRNKTVELPGEFAAQMPRGKKNSVLYPIVALALVREQLRRGAIQIEDDPLAALLRISPRQVQRIRQDLRRSGLLDSARRDRPCDVLTFPGATARDPDPAALDPSRTRRLVPLQTAAFPAPVTLYASQPELAHAARRVARLGPHITTVAITTLDCRSFRASHRDGEADTRELPLHAADLLDTLNELEADPPAVYRLDTLPDLVPFEAPDPTASQTAHSPQDRRSNTLSGTVETPGLLPPTSKEERDYEPFSSQDAQAPEPASGPGPTSFAREEKRASTGEGSGALAGSQDAAQVEPQRDSFSSPPGAEDWPHGVAGRAVELFGERAVTAGTKTHRLLDQRIRHALRVWNEKYGPLAGERAEYAAQRLLDALEYLSSLPSDRDRYAVLTEGTPFLQLVNDDETHAGFKERPWTPDAAPTAGENDYSAEVAAFLDELGATRGFNEDAA